MSPLTTVLAADTLAVHHRTSLRFPWLAAALLAGALAAGLTAWAAATSTTLVSPAAAAPLRGAIVLAYALAGTYTLWRGQTGRFGYLLIALGLTYALTSLVASGDADVHSVGRLLNAAWVGFYVYVFLAFPSGRLGSTFERAIVGVYVVSASVLWPFVTLTAKKMPASGVFTDCGKHCPANGLRAWDVSSRGVVVAVAVVTVGVALAAVYALARKVWSPVGLERNTVAPILLAAIGVILAYVVFSLHPAGGSWRTVNLVVAGTGALFAPIAFALAPLRGELYVSRNMWRGLSRLDYAKLSARQVEDVCRNALGDSSLRLALAIPRDGLCDVDGAPVDLPPGETETITRIARPEGRSAVLHEPVLGRGYRQVVERVGALAFTLVDYTRVFQELVLSRRRIAERDGAERSRLERDLHDGAQQRLVAIQLKLAELNGSVRGTPLEGPLRDVSEDASSAIAELRRIAQGLYPPLLLERGLADALRERPAVPSLPVEIVDKGIGRVSPAAERALYFASLEAIQNATKHAGADAVTVTLEPLVDLVEVTIVDDGSGFDEIVCNGGSGLTGIRDRIGSVGGEVEIAPGPGGGTVVRYLVPREPNGAS